MKRLVSMTIPLAAISFLCCSVQISDFPVVQGWTQAGDVSVYDADNLWEYINGAAELFTDYGIHTCRTSDLSSGDVTVTVDLYDMGTPLNAFGIFTLESSGRGEPFPGAVEAVISPPFQALLLKGDLYVKVHTAITRTVESFNLGKVLIGDQAEDRLLRSEDLVR